MTAFSDLTMSSPDAANQKLEDVMEAMAGGHMPAILHFWQEFSGKMCRTIRGILRELDQRDLAADAEYVRDLAFECCWVIFDRAPQWNNEDDPPWQWARPLLIGWVQDWLEQTGEVEGASDFGTLEEFGYEGSHEFDEDELEETKEDDTASDFDPFEPDAQPRPDALMPELTISGESRSMSDRFDEALGLRPKT